MRSVDPEATSFWAWQHQSDCLFGHIDIVDTYCQLGDYPARQIVGLDAALDAAME